MAMEQLGWENEGLAQAPGAHVEGDNRKMARRWKKQDVLVSLGGTGEGKRGVKDVPRFLPWATGWAAYAGKDQP